MLEVGVASRTIGIRSAKMQTLTYSDNYFILQKHCSHIANACNMTAFLLEYHFLPVSYVYAACGVRYPAACKVVVGGVFTRQTKLAHRTFG